MRPGGLFDVLKARAVDGALAAPVILDVLLPDGSRLISDEYGPSIYRFSAAGEFMGALPVAPSVRPIRNGVTDYSSNNPETGKPYGLAFPMVTIKDMVHAQKQLIDHGLGEALGHTKDPHVKNGETKGLQTHSGNL